MVFSLHVQQLIFILYYERITDMLFTDQLNQILQYYKDLANHYREESGNLPDGYLLWQNNHGYDQFLHVINSDKKVYRRGISHDEELKRALARKEFLSLALDDLSHNISILSLALSKIVPFDPDAIMAKMKKAYRLLPEEYCFDRKQFIIDTGPDNSVRERIERHLAFGQEEYEQSRHYQHKKKHRTSRGELVRSRVEALILERLYYYGIACHYDEILTKNNILLVPDFTFEGAYGRRFYWEYMGMMSDPGYAHDNIEKLKKYYLCGIVPGRDLIVTFDPGDSVDMMVIDAVIQTQIIPRL